eukprot:363952-Chlamydomonas_euryale.AAC.3
MKEGLPVSQVGDGQIGETLDLCAATEHVYMAGHPSQMEIYFGAQTAASIFAFCMYRMIATN